MLNLVALHGTAKGNEKCTCIVTDEAKAMTSSGRITGLFRRNGVESALIQCIVHQEVICGKFLRPTNTPEVIVRITDLIRGENKTLTHRKIREFLSEINAN
ncbi:uncharacterized protein LOC119688536 [Teleopsis dalmanni]|uniref:uncharacterized protein LOC119688536 n=1 Tax=Teleopsis dalmanni TaxID=139649 RepID=UPI0018CCF223|nr:uncharacterized protein LOC119688536 [Teleopsis dalmanni]